MWGERLGEEEEGDRIRGRGRGGGGGKEEKGEVIYIWRNVVYN